MKFAVVGGDERSAILAGLLAADGHKVRCYALEKAVISEDAARAGCLQGAVYGADCVILPLPAERSGLLNCPLSDTQLTLQEVFFALWPGQLVLGGKFSREICAKAQQDGLYLADLMAMPSFIVGNAALTAEGAVEQLIAASKASLWRGKVLITGWGRIASILAIRLLAMGARVCIAARNSQDRAMAEAVGCSAVAFEELESKIGKFEYIVNTVPARVIEDAALCCVAQDAVLLELASPPGGFDRNLAENIGVNIRLAPGLPGKCAPLTGARLMQQAVYGAIKDRED